MKYALIALLLAVLPLKAHAFMLNGGPSSAGGTLPLAFDGGASSFGNGSSGTQAITTANANGVILVLTKVTTGGTSAVSSITDTSGLTWTKRSSNMSQYDYELWYAIAPTAVTNRTVMVTFNASVAFRITVFAVSGVNTTTPFDPNASASNARNTTSGTSLAPLSALATTKANDMLIATIQGFASLGTITPPAGYTSFGIAAGTSEDVDYQIVSTPQSGLSPTFTWTSSGAAGGIWDALQAAGQ